ncbi:basic helix-loop-helix protein A-like [Mangifera indica]|uniref:basic helix-loop-helix protein A-like n=1 Tax=Mangifera indica TaxID=29780 RepID=UPI001CFA1D3F|nr:basic helix-loop-helix protein A-like [Mangifera indica]
MSPSHEIFVSKEGGSSCRKRSRAIKEDGERGTIEKSKDRRMRDRMNQKYNELQSMLPKTSLFKASREKIVSETIEHIKALKEELQRLEEQKNSSTSMVAKGKLSTCSSNNSSINVTVSGDIVFFGIQSLARQRLVTDVFIIFHEQGTEVLSANVAVNNGLLMLTVTALVNGNKDTIIEKIKRDILIL